MPVNRDKKRKAWFDQGVEALKACRPSAPAVYGCPLCLQGFSTLEFLTFEDVPPKSIGGRPLVLTCKRCNRASGRLLDPNIKAGARLREIAEGKAETWIKLSQFGHTISAKANLGPGGIVIAGEPKKSNPKEHASLFEKLERAAVEGTQGIDFTISVPMVHNAWREEVGWLRVAYLYAFAALGYNFILRSELTPIREQIRKPDDKLVPYIMGKEAQDSAGIMFVHEPEELRSIAVAVAKRILFFPCFDEAPSFHDRFRAREGLNGPWTISGKQMGLPSRPAFIVDFGLDSSNTAMHRTSGLAPSCR